MKKGISKPFTRAQAAELKSLAALPDPAIDKSDAPELLDWSGAKRGLFYRPVKQQLTLRLDSDVVSWFKGHTKSGEGYQTRINRALRDTSPDRHESSGEPAGLDFGRRRGWPEQACTRAGEMPNPGVRP